MSFYTELFDQFFSRVGLLFKALVAIAVLSAVSCTVMGGVATYYALEHSKALARSAK